MPCNSPNELAAAFTLWPDLHAQEGTSVLATWDELFKSWLEPPPFRGKLSQAGWSASICDPPRRGTASVVAMTALVLDYDGGTTIDAGADLWSDYYGALHTTSSHTASNPHFRIVLPLARNVSREEYAIVWRWAQKLAASAGQKIDASTKDVARVWFAPARTEDYEVRRLGGSAPLDPDGILAAHKYDEHERQRAATESVAPRGDTEKRAAAYLRKLPASISGSGGHQALWTAALALVRGFRVPPARALAMLRSDFNPRCQPPWSEKELRHKIDGAEQDATTEYGYLADRFRAVPTPPPDVDPDYVPAPPPDFVDDPVVTPSAPRVASVDDWTAQLATDTNSNVRKTFDNICRILEHHEAYGPRLAYDEMRLTPMIAGRAVSDADVGRVRREIEQQFKIQPSEADVRAAIGTVADARRYHPVQQYLSGLSWDGEERINRVVPDILGADNTALNQAMVSKWFVAAAARALKPGCKVDTALVLVGRQRARKSSFFSVLGGEWFADTHMDISDKDGLLQLHSAWIYEWAEIENVTTSRKASEVKAFASSSHDTFRTPFGRTTAVHPRSTVIVGSTNEDQFLTDPTGSRRFNIVRTSDRVRYELAAEWRDQLWAEAVQRFQAGETWWLSDDEEVNREAAAEQYQVEDSWEEPVAEWLDAKPPTITTSRLLDKALGLPASQRGSQAERRVAAIMRRLGYCQRRQRAGGGSALRVWVRS